MALQLAKQWWMGALTALTGSVLLALNLRRIGAHGPSRVTLLSVASAGFVVVLGWALTIQPSENS